MSNVVRRAISRDSPRGDLINAIGLGVSMLVGAAVAVCYIVNPLLSQTPDAALVFELGLRLGLGALAGGIAWKALQPLATSHRRR